MTRSPTSKAASRRSTRPPKERERPAAQKSPRDDGAVVELLKRLRFDRNGLIPAVAQQFDSGEVLMLAWMSREAVAETLRTGRVCYWSRSRKTLWRKGERSGQIQRLIELRLDCDQDTLLLQVDQKGVACHTGRRSCFFTALRRGRLEEIAEVIMDPQTLYGE